MRSLSFVLSSSNDSLDGRRSNTVHSTPVESFSLLPVPFDFFSRKYTSMEKRVVPRESAGQAAKGTSDSTETSA